MKQLWLVAATMALWRQPIWPGKTVLMIITWPCRSLIMALMMTMPGRYFMISWFTIGRRLWSRLWTNSMFSPQAWYLYCSLWAKTFGWRCRLPRFKIILLLLHFIQILSPCPWMFSILNQRSLIFKSLPSFSLSQWTSIKEDFPPEHLKTLITIIINFKVLL